MGSPSNSSSNHWKSLAEELGAPWPEEETSAAETEPEAAAAAPVADAHVETTSEPEEVESDLKAQEPATSNDDSDDVDALFGDDSETRDLFDDADDADEPELVVKEPSAPSVRSEPIVPAPTLVTPSPDRSHWRSLLAELGLEAPPEPEEQPLTAEATSSEAPSAAVVEPERFGASEPEIVDAELVEEVEQEPPAPPLPFGAGLFTEEEERQFAPPTPAIQYLTAEEAIETTEFTELTEDESEKEVEGEAVPKKRGRRRTRRWKRLHTAAEGAAEPESADTLAQSDEYAAASAEVVDEIFGDEEATPEAEAPGPDEEPRKRRRRRRRRPRKGEVTSQERSAEELAEVEDEDSATADILEGDHESEEALEVAEGQPARRDRSTRRGAAADFDEGDEDDRRDNGRPSHRQIPTWEEAVGIVIAANMEARAKAPSGRRRR